MSAMPAPPVLVEVTRGRVGEADALVESRHRGSLALVDGHGETILALGDIASPVYPRSAVKTFQALALVLSGAADEYRFGPAELSVAQASHDAEPEHLAVVGGMLGVLGLEADDLACGVPVRRAPNPRSDDAPLTPLHHECSGKHAGMLAVARHLGVDPAGYERLDHPVQQRVRAALEAVTGATLTPQLCGTDGCSLPTWAAPLEAFARGFAHLATAPGEVGEAGRRLIEAVGEAPQMIWGTGQFDTRVGALLGPDVLTKRGAEGVYCGVVRPRADGGTTLARSGFGFAVKIEDGAQRAARTVAAAVLQAALRPAGEAGEMLASFAERPIRTARGAVAGSVRPSGALREALAALSG